MAAVAAVAAMVKVAAVAAVDAMAALAVAAVLDSLTTYLQLSPSSIWLTCLASQNTEQETKEKSTKINQTNHEAAQSGLQFQDQCWFQGYPPLPLASQHPL